MTVKNSKLKIRKFTSNSPEETFRFGEEIGESLQGGEIILLKGSLGAGKTLLTKGILNSLEFDIDEVNSPSFTLVNEYEAKFDVFHIDLWRLEGGSNMVFAVGLDEILEDEKAIVIIEWSEKLNEVSFDRNIIEVKLQGDGDEPRNIQIKYSR